MKKKRHNPDRDPSYQLVMQMMRRWSAATNPVLGAMVVLLAGGGGDAKAAGQEWKERLTHLPPGDFPILEPCVLGYRLSWNGVLKAGETQISFYSRGKDGKTPSEIYTLATMRSAGLARALWPYDGKNESWMDRDDLVPIRVLQEEEDRREVNIYRTEFDRSTVRNEWITVEKEESGQKEERKRSYPQTSPPMKDLVSAMLYVRSLPLAELKKPISIICYPFRDPYVVTLTPKGKEKHDMLGKEVPALKFGISLSKIESDQSLKTYDHKMQAAHFWISDDAQRIPLELKADIFIGHILVTLKEYRKLGSSALAPVAGKTGRRVQPVVADSEGRTNRSRTLFRKRIRGGSH